MNGLRRYAAAAAAVTLVSVPTSAVAGGGGASDGVDSYFPAAGSMAYDVANYSLQIRYDPTSRSFAGAATISATANVALSSLDLDLRGFTVRSVTVDGKPAGFRLSGRKLTVSPLAALRQGAKFSVGVRYDGTTGRPTDGTGALYGWISTPDGAYVPNEPDGASTWYPVNDRPTDKATYDFQVTVPAGKTAVTNGELIDTQTTKDWTTWRWRATDAMSSYLATVAIGDYSLRRTTGPGGLPVLTAVDRKLPAGVDAALDRTNEMISYFSQVLGPYPFTSYGAIIDDDIDAGYSLETQTRPIYAGPPTEDDVAHETAHQWLGDSVGPRHWQDIWLTEGMTTYLQWLWAEHTGGVSAEQAFADAYGVPAADAFWSIPPGDPGAENMFADPVYTRGAMTMHVLRAKIGDDAFFTMLRRWCSLYRGVTASTADLISLAEQVSGKDLDSLFQAWLYKPHKPAFTAGIGSVAHPRTPKPNKHRPAKD